MNYSAEIAGAVREFFDCEEWNYTFDENEGIFRTGINLECKLGSTDIVLKIGEDYFTTYAGIKMSASADCRSAVAEFIVRANYGLRNGNFEMDLRDGEIRYKSFNNCAGIVPSTAIITDAVMIPALMIDRYGDGLVSVMFGIRTPEEAIEIIENQ